MDIIFMDMGGGSLYLRLDRWVLLVGAQLSSLSLPGGSAVLRGSLVSAPQDSRGGPCTTPILRSVIPTRPLALRLGEVELLPPPASSLWWSLWPAYYRTIRLCTPSLSSPLGDPSLTTESPWAQRPLVAQDTQPSSPSRLHQQ